MVLSPHQMAALSGSGVVLCRRRLLGLERFKSSKSLLVEFQALGQASVCEGWFREGGSSLCHAGVVYLPRPLSAAELPRVLPYASTSTINRIATKLAEWKANTYHEQADF